MKTTKLVRLKPATQTWVDVTTKRDGTMLVDPCKPLYTKGMCLASTGVADVKSDQQFRILVVNFSDYEVDLLPHQVVATDSEHRETLVKLHLSHAAVFVLIPSEKDKKFRKQHKNGHDIETIKKAPL